MSKKNILLSLCLFIIIIVFVYFSMQNTKFLVAIDVGHSLKQPGAISSIGIREFEYNKNFAKILKTSLEKKGIDAIIIGEFDFNMELAKRGEYAKENGADILLSIHHDSVQPIYLRQYTKNGMQYLFTDKYKGFSLFVSKRNKYFDKSFHLAKDIGTNLVLNGMIPSLHHAEKISGENRILLIQDLGIYQFDDLIILHTTELPAVLIECGVILNIEEEELLRNANYQQKLSESISEAIVDYRNENNLSN